MLKEYKNYNAGFTLLYQGPNRNHNIKSMTQRYYIGNIDKDLFTSLKGFVIPFVDEIIHTAEKRYCHDRKRMVNFVTHSIHLYYMFKFPIAGRPKHKGITNLQNSINYLGPKNTLVFSEPNYPKHIEDIIKRKQILRRLSYSRYKYNTITKARIIKYKERSKYRTQND